MRKSYGRTQPVVWEINNKFEISFQKAFCELSDISEYLLLVFNAVGYKGLHTSQSLDR